MNRERHMVPTSPATIALILLTLLFASAGTVPALAQTPTTFYSFVNGSSDAACPTGNIVDGRDGNGYGAGASCRRGTSFAMVSETRDRCGANGVVGSCGNLRGHAGGTAASATEVHG
jgi:hypothetical protein